MASKHSQSTERALVAEAMFGSEAAFGELCRRLRPALLRGALKRARQLGLEGEPAMEAAEDAVQEGLIAGWFGLGRVRDPDRFGAWLGRIVSHKVHRGERKKRPQTGVPPSLLERESKALPADEELEKREREAQVSAAVEGLPEHERTPILLHYVDGLSLSEIGNAVGIPLSTVKWRMYRGRERLRSVLKEHRNQTSKRSSNNG